jgi:hypothetical protein
MMGVKHEGSTDAILFRRSPVVYERQRQRTSFPHAPSPAYPGPTLALLQLPVSTLRV